MNKSGPVIIIEDDEDDKDILDEVFKKLGYPNNILFFQNGQSALDYLYESSEMPFLILSDINLPKLDGFALRQKIKTDAELEIKCIPYLFFTTASNQKAVIEAYSMSVQGFFIKPGSITEIEETISAIMEYWSRCSSPNNFR
jgi:CheY-like chemotaxis protein